MKRLLTPFLVLFPFFVFAQIVPIDNAMVRDLHFADFNGDGLQDFVALYATADSPSTNIAYLQRMENGYFEEPVFLLSQNQLPWAPGGIGVMDFDEDGDMDIAGVFGDQSTGKLIAITNSGSGTFSVNVYGDGFGEPPESWQVFEDYTYTGKPLAVKNGTEDALRFIGALYCYDDQGQFTGYEHHLMGVYDNGFGSNPFIGGGITEPFVDCMNVYPGGLFSEIVEVDIDGVGQKEILVGFVPYAVPGQLEKTILIPNYFSAPDTIDVGMVYNQFMAADLDGDGDQDLVLQTENGIRSMINDGNGNFAAPTFLFSGGRFDLADVDSDGDTDFVSLLTDGVAIHYNDGNGVFGQTEIISGEMTDIFEIYIAPISNEPGAQNFAIATNGFYSDFESGSYFIPLSPACPSDISGDGVTNIDDFNAFNSAYGTSCNGCPEDINGDGNVDIEDFLLFNSAFGEPCD